MKKGFKWFIKWFKRWINDMSSIEKIIFAIAAIIGIIAGVLIFVATDVVPATTYDYAPLEEQAAGIEQNPSLLFSTDCDISVENKIITVTLENEECSLISKYDEHFNLLSTSKIDNSIHWLLALTLSILSAFFIYGVGAYLIFLLILLVLVLYELFVNIITKFKSLKTSDKQSNN